MIKPSIGDGPPKVYRTPATAKFFGWDGYCTNNKPCKIGEGDCDSDEHCQKGLKCFQRGSYNKDALVPGVVDLKSMKRINNAKYGHIGWEEVDVCYDPAAGG